MEPTEGNSGEEIGNELPVILIGYLLFCDPSFLSHEANEANQAKNLALYYLPCATASSSSCGL